MTPRMTETEAYDRPYSVRILFTYRPGDLVRVGPAYRMGGYYVDDGDEGIYTVCRRIGESSDYKLVRGEWSFLSDVDLEDLQWEVIVHASRLERFVEPRKRNV